MGHDADSSTSPTLIGRLKLTPTDQAAWHSFVKRYGPQVDRWARCWFPNAHAAEDVAAEVFLRLLKRMQTFEYCPEKRFRSWLKSVVHGAAMDYCNAQGREFTVGSPDAAFVLDSAQASNDLSDCLAKEHHLELLEKACACVRLQVQPNTWEVFELSRDGILNGAQIAQRLGISISMVYVARTRVIARIKNQIEIEIEILDRME